VLLVVTVVSFIGYVAVSHGKQAKKITTAVEQPKPQQAVPQVPVATAQPATPATPSAKRTQPVATSTASKPSIQEPLAEKKLPRFPRTRPAAQPGTAVSTSKLIEEVSQDMSGGANTPSSRIEVMEEPAAPRVAARPARQMQTPSMPGMAMRTLPRLEDTEEGGVGGGGGGEAATVFIASIPPVADIYMDGKLIGKTNISELKVTSGTHSLRFVKGDKEVSKQMTFQVGKNPSQMVRLQ
jgi:hypothetical protein